MLAQKSHFDKKSVLSPMESKSDRTISVIRMNKFLKRRLMVFGIIAGTISLSLVSTLVNQSAILEEKEAEKQRLQLQFSKLEAKEKELDHEIVKLNEPEYLAKIARRDYFLSGKGEIIFNLGK